MLWWEGCVEGIVGLVNLVQGSEVHLDVDWNEEPMEVNNVDD